MSQSSQQAVTMNQLTRNDFASSLLIQSRWADNDIYGHINNVVYYSYFDTAVNHYLINSGGLDIQSATVIGVVAESQCQYFQSISYPEVVEVHIRIKKLSQRSVIYEIGIFKQNNPDICAFGHFVHVFVERDTNKATQIPPAIRDALEQLTCITA